MKCIYCESDHTEKTWLCVPCQRDLSPLVAPHMYCGDCKRPLLPETSFCGACAQRKTPSDVRQRVKKIDSLTFETAENIAPEIQTELLRTRRINFVIKSSLISVILLILAFLMWGAIVWIRQPDRPHFSPATKRQAPITYNDLTSPFHSS